MFSAISNKKNYEYIVEQIQTMIIDKTLKPGDILPPENLLSEQFCVSRTSIREAIKVLSAMGLVESRQGEGIFVVDELAASTTKNLSLMFTLNNGTIDDLIVLRRCIEVEAGKILIDKNNSDEINLLTSIMDQYNAANNSDERTKWDKTFHTTLIHLADNLFFSYFIDALSHLIMAFMDDMINITIAIESEQYLIDEHNKIMNAILDRDLSAFEKAMRHHIDIGGEENMKTFTSKYQYWSLK